MTEYFLNARDVIDTFLLSRHGSHRTACDSDDEIRILKLLSLMYPFLHQKHFLTELSAVSITMFYVELLDVCNVKIK